MTSVTKIRYTKDDGTTERWIVPLEPLESNINAIDVTSLEEAEREKISQNYAEYSGYLRQHMKQAFSFEDWLAHSKNEEFAPRWRTFKPNKTEILS